MPEYPSTKFCAPDLVTSSRASGVAGLSGVATGLPPSGAGAGAGTEPDTACPVTRPAATHPGAFGLALSGSLVPVSSAGLQAAPVDWPVVEVGWAPAPPGPQSTEHAGHAGYDEHIGDDRARLRVGAGSLDCDRVRRSAVFRTIRPLREEELLHPCLGMVATVFGRWLGHLVFHGGAVVVDGSAWVLIGDKEAGKSTTLAWLAACGMGVLADDLVVVAGRRVLAGPRCADLRPPTVDHLAGSVEPTAVRGGLRGRILLPPVAPEVPLGGWVVLEPADTVSVVRVPAAERIGRLGLNLAARMAPRYPSALLDLAAFPMWSLRRPLRLASLPLSADLLLAAIATGRPQRAVPAP